MILKAAPLSLIRTAMRPLAPVILALSAAALLSNCETSSLPTAESLSAGAKVLREQARPEFEELDRKRAMGLLSEEEYQGSRAALEKRISDDARDAAWSRHFLAESERKANGLPTPDAPQAIGAPNALAGGVGGGGVSGDGSLYRPFTQQAQGAGNYSNSNGVIPSMGNRNNVGASYVPTAPQ